MPFVTCGNEKLISVLLSGSLNAMNGSACDNWCECFHEIWCTNPIWTYPYMSSDLRKIISTVWNLIERRWCEDFSNFHVKISGVYWGEATVQKFSAKPSRNHTSTRSNPIQKFFVLIWTQKSSGPARNSFGRLCIWHSAVRLEHSLIRISIGLSRNSAWKILVGCATICRQCGGTPSPGMG